MTLVGALLLYLLVGLLALHWRTDLIRTASFVQIIEIALSWPEWIFRGRR